MTVLLVHMSRCPVCFCSPLVLAKSQLDNHVDAELNVVQWHTFWRVVCCEPHRCHSRSSSSGRRFSQWLIPVVSSHARDLEHCVCLGVPSRHRLVVQLEFTHSQPLLRVFGRVPPVPALPSHRRLKHVPRSEQWSSTEIERTNGDLMLVDILFCPPAVRGNLVQRRINNEKAELVPRPRWDPQILPWSVVAFH